MAKDAPLEITYWEKVAKANPTAFFAQIDDRITQVKSLTFNADHFDHLPTILETTSATNLETLVFWGQRWGENTATLFGGKPASPALKNVRVRYIPVALGSLRLSGLRSLELNNIPITSVEELLRILMESPALEDCSLSSLFLPGFTPEEHLQGILGGQRSMTDANCRAIRLLHLRHLTLFALPVAFIHFLLSNIQASRLQSFSVQCGLDESPASELLTADISHLAPALKCSTDPADKIEINLLGDSSWTVCIGMLTIGFEGVWVKPRQVEETLDWVFGYLGEHLKDLPTSLVTGELDMHTNLVLWLATNLRVTNLELRTGIRFSQPRRMISLLSRPVAPMSNQWALPDLELIDLNVLDEAGKWEILEMVEARHSFIQAQEDQGRGDVALKQFKEIKLCGGRNSFSKELGPNAEFLSAIEKVGRGAEIWWEGVKWIGSRA